MTRGDIESGIYIGQAKRSALLEHAARTARERNFDFPVVDVDAHHFDTPIEEIAPYLPEPWRHRFLAMTTAELLPHDIGDRIRAGRIKRPRHEAPPGERLPQAIYPFKETAAKLGIDCSVVFPTDMLTLGLHPDASLEVAMAEAYARWMSERVLPYEPSVVSMLYLPFSDPEASLKMIETFAGKKGVVGFMVTSLRYQHVYERPYLKIYAALEEAGLPLGFHSVPCWRERPFELFDNFLSTHALGFPFYNSIHLINLVMNGIPERFPGLKLLFFEGGVAYLPQLLFRLDSAYMMYRSELSSLKRKPSEYIQQFYFSSQPLEWPDPIEALAPIFDMIHAPTQLLYSSDYPHWDFDTTSQISDLPFLSTNDKKQILGGNAVRLFGLETETHDLMRLRRERLGLLKKSGA